jgi:VanZ family protein
MDKSNKIWRERIIRYAPLILWIVVIFIASSSTGAMSNTSRFIRPFLEWLFPDASAETLTIYHGYIRKFAHFAEYAMLAFWTWRAFKDKKYWYLAALVLVALVASIDEYNQSFNVLRTSSPYDVLLDISGGIFMILVIWAISRRAHRER